MKTYRSEELVERLYSARQAAKAAKKAWDKASWNYDHKCPGNARYIVDCHARLVYHSMCKDCPISPLYREYISKTNKAGSILRALLRHGKHLVQQRHGNSDRG